MQSHQPFDYEKEADIAIRVIRNKKGIVKVINAAFYNTRTDDVNNHDFDFLLKQLADPENVRPKRRVPGHADRSTIYVYNSSTKKFVQTKRIVDESKRGQPKEKTIFTKKTATTLLPAHGMINLFSYNNTIGLLFDESQCSISPKYIFNQNVGTDSCWWISGVTLNISAYEQYVTTLDDIRAKHDTYVASKTCAGDWNEILSRLSKQSMRAVFVPLNASVQITDHVIAPAINGIHKQLLTYHRVGIELPILFISNNVEPAVYSLADQCKHLKTALGRDSTAVSYHLSLKIFTMMPFPSALGNYIVEHANEFEALKFEPSDELNVGFKLAKQNFDAAAKLLQDDKKYPSTTIARLAGWLEQNPKIDNAIPQSSTLNTILMQRGGVRFNTIKNELLTKIISATNDTELNELAEKVEKMFRPEDIAWLETKLYENPATNYFPLFKTKLGQTLLKKGSLSLSYAMNKHEKHDESLLKEYALVELVNNQQLLQALMNLIWKEKWELAKWLMKIRRDIPFKEYQYLGKSPLFWALEKKSYDIQLAKKLSCKEALASKTIGLEETAVKTALRQQRWELIEYWILHHLNHLENEQIRELIFVTVQLKQYALTDQILLSSATNITNQSFDKEGNLALHLAVQEKDIDHAFLHRLISADTKTLETKNKKGDTPLLLSLRNPELFIHLLSCWGIKISAGYQNQLFLALVAENNFALAEKMVDLHCVKEFNEPDAKGNQPLHFILSADDTHFEKSDSRNRFVKKLYACGADIFSENHEKVSPAGLMLKQKREELIRDLYEDTLVPMMFICAMIKLERFDLAREFIDCNVREAKNYRNSLTRKALIDLVNDTITDKPTDDHKDFIRYLSGIGIEFNYYLPHAFHWILERLLSQNKLSLIEFYLNNYIDQFNMEHVDTLIHLLIQKGHYDLTELACKKKPEIIEKAECATVILEGTLSESKGNQAIPTNLIAMLCKQGASLDSKLGNQTCLASIAKEPNKTLLHHLLNTYTDRISVSTLLEIFQVLLSANDNDNLRWIINLIQGKDPRSLTNIVELVYDSKSPNIELIQHLCRNGAKVDENKKPEETIFFKSIKQKQHNLFTIFFRMFLPGLTPQLLSLCVPELFINHWLEFIDPLLNDAKVCDELKKHPEALTRSLNEMKTPDADRFIDKLCELGADPFADWNKNPSFFRRKVIAGQESRAKALLKYNLKSANTEDSAKIIELLMANKAYETALTFLSKNSSIDPQASCSGLGTLIDNINEKDINSKDSVPLKLAEAYYNVIQSVPLAQQYGLSVLRCESLIETAINKRLYPIVHYLMELFASPRVSWVQLSYLCLKLYNQRQYHLVAHAFKAAKYSPRPSLDYGIPVLLNNTLREAAQSPETQLDTIETLHKLGATSITEAFTDAVGAKRYDIAHCLMKKQTEGKSFADAANFAVSCAEIIPELIHASQYPLVRSFLRYIAPDSLQVFETNLTFLFGEKSSGGEDRIRENINLLNKIKIRYLSENISLKRAVCERLVRILIQNASSAEQVIKTVEILEEKGNGEHIRDRRGLLVPFITVGQHIWRNQPVSRTWANLMVLAKNRILELTQSDPAASYQNRVYLFLGLPVTESEAKQSGILLEAQNYAALLTKAAAPRTAASAVARH